MLIQILLSFGYIDALVPLLIIMILIAAAAGLTRGWDALKLFGIETLVGAGGIAGKGSLTRKSAYQGSKVVTAAIKSPPLKKNVAAKIKNARDKIVTGRQTNQATNSLTQYVMTPPSGGRGTTGTGSGGSNTSVPSQTQAGQATSRNIKTPLVTYGLKAAAGAALVGGGLLAPLGYKRIRKVGQDYEYNYYKREYENAKTKEEKEKWASKMYGMMEKQGIVPTSQLEFSAAEHAHDYLKKHFVPGSILSKENADSLQKKLKNIERTRQLNVGIQKLQEDYNRSKISAADVKSEVRKLVKDYYTPGFKEAEVASAVGAAMPKTAPQISTSSRSRFDYKKRLKQTAGVAATGGLAVPLRAGHEIGKRMNLGGKFDNRVIEAVAKKQFKEDFKDELDKLDPNKRKDILNNQRQKFWVEYWKAKNKSRIKNKNFMTDKEYNDEYKKKLKEQLGI
jgi:hypothetical protein